MLTALLLGAALGLQSWDGKLQGVWASTNGDVFVFCGKHGTFIKNSEFGWVEFDRLNPQGQSWYIWSTGDAPTFIGSKRLTNQKDVALTHSSEWVLTPRTPRSWGWMKMATTPNPRRLNYTMQDSQDSVLTRGSLDFVADSAYAYVDGTYSGPNNVSATIVLGDAGKLTGTFVYAGMSASLKGTFAQLKPEFFTGVGSNKPTVAAVGVVSLLSTTTGAAVGNATFFWNGGTKTIESLKTSKSAPADKILLRFNLMDRSQLPNGMTVMLTRKEDS